MRWLLIFLPPKILYRVFQRNRVVNGSPYPDRLLQGHLCFSSIHYIEKPHIQKQCYQRYTHVHIGGTHTGRNNSTKSLLTGIGPYSLLENILLAAELACQDNAKNREWALSLLRRLNIEEKANEKIENLSGGQKQRVAIARALAGNPQVILADEPTGALDRKTADEIMAILSEIAKQSPVLIITHDRKICDYADEVVTIEEGKCKVWEETKKQTATVLTQKKKLPDVPVSMSKRALHNFKTHFKRFFGISLAVTIAVCAVLMSFSSQNIVEEKINHFKEKNTAFSWGQILLEENDTVEGVLSLLEQSPDIQQHYVQYQSQSAR